MKRPTDVIAIDPGDVHVGVAMWLHQAERVRAHEIAAGNDAIYQIQSAITRRIEAGSTVHLVIEEFRLYPNKAGAQSWSPMKTAEMIGALKWIAHITGTPVFMQGAAIKNVIRRQCKARGIKVRSGVSDHADDAVLHMWYHLLNQELMDPELVRPYCVVPNYKEKS